MLRQPLAEVGGREEPVDEPLVGVGPGVVDERGGVVGGRRQSREVERQAADQRGAVGTRRGRQALLGELDEDESVDVVADEAGVAGHVGRRVPGRRDVGPVALPFGPLLDPAAERLDLGLRERPARPLGGHPLGVIVRDDPLDQGALARLAGDDHRPVLPLRERPLLLVEPEARLALALVGAVALEAGLGEDRADVAVEVDWTGLARGEGRTSRQEREARHEEETSHRVGTPWRVRCGAARGAGSGSDPG